ncbi:LuxR family transcriptional regulator [Thiocapsa imhoffii]|uniref:LuxR family transcriptional regulator n=1 Tax=Thiocapsa imhoffii TaxID=382777 RepID=A0A9X0WJY7_9GAMM|nr:autoinducer binding domain-containing protein [Thiocapsa imhoffii]MBK1646126.1 LuxR family transcriptional regulator [Thiocapsa imhoffii]
MAGWQEDQLHLLLTIDDERELFDRLSLVARGLGFDYCAYGLRTPVPISRPRILMLNNYPLGWQARYQKRGYLAIDPTVKHGTHSSLPLLWSDAIFASARELWEEARSFGLHVGWAQSSRDARGMGGLLTLARSDEPLSDAELRDKAAKMSWLTQIAHIGMSRCLGSQLLPDTESHLTERELTVLRWTADGKTSGDISIILGISERTVNFHINNAVGKLGTVNKLAAAVKAAVLGML